MPNKKGLCQSHSRLCEGGTTEAISLTVNDEILLDCFTTFAMTTFVTASFYCSIIMHELKDISQSKLHLPAAYQLGTADEGGR